MAPLRSYVAACGARLHIGPSWEVFNSEPVEYHFYKYANGGEEIRSGGIFGALMRVKIEIS